MRIEAMQSRAPASLARRSVLDAVVQEGLELLLGVEAFPLIPRSAECGFHDSRCGRRGFRELRGGDLKERGIVRLELALERVLVGER
jgi:hypothetical protein